MYTGRNSHACVLAIGQVYVIGGYCSGSTAAGVKYIVEQDMWEKVETLPTLSN